MTKDDSSPATKDDLRKQNIAISSKIDDQSKVLRSEMKSLGKLMQDQIEMVLQAIMAERDALRDEIRKGDEETHRQLAFLIEHEWCNLRDAHHDEMIMVKDKIKRHDKDISEIRTHVGMISV